MSSPAPFEPIAQLLERSLSIRHVYGEPVKHGDMTVIPVARVAYAFGAGGGQVPRRLRRNGSGERAPEIDGGFEAQGGGGGGGARMTPAGALEIGPQGAHFVYFHPLMPWIYAGAAGLVAGWWFGRRR